ncbi:MAG: ABC-three component system protein [Xanthobacteraceae bacterium]
MTSEQRYWWRIALELKLRKCSGEEFQDFFSKVMEKVHTSDFIRVRPFGTLGDKGCDGYLQSTGRVFACYGALNGDGSKVSYLVGKMGDDYAKAANEFASVMKAWAMVHNLVDGLPAEAILKLEVIQAINPKCPCAFIGMEGFEELVFSLDEGEIEPLLGMVATARDAQNFQAKELSDLIAAVISAADETPIDVNTIRPVPVNKLDFNQLPSHWRFMIAGGWQNAHFVQEYLDRRPDPMIGERIAQKFRDRYQYLKSQRLESGAIMSNLYEGVTGVGAVMPERQVAAQALLAHLFESCDIFETPPEQRKAAGA